MSASGLKEAAKVYNRLQALDIQYEIVHHDPIFTSNREVPAFKNLEVLDIKNLFLKGYKGKHHYLVVMPYDKLLDLGALANMLNEKSLSLASEERLMQHLGCAPGAVSIFGLLNDDAHEVMLVLDPEVLEAEKVGFHPNTPSETLIFGQEAFRIFLDSLERDVKII